MCPLIAVTIDCHDVDKVSVFRARALGQEVGRRWEDGDGVIFVELDGHVTPTFGRPVLLFQRVSEEKACKNRVHVDVVVPAGDAAAEEVTRLVDLGATVVEKAEDRPWVVMADPERNEFCVRVGPRSRRDRPGGAVRQGRPVAPSRPARLPGPGNRPAR